MTKHYIALVLSILSNATSLILLKKLAIGELSASLSQNNFRALFNVFLNPLFLVSVACFGIGVIFWMYALVRIDLSLAYPTVSSSYLFIAIVSLYLFDEKIPLNRWLGILIVVFGIVVMYAWGGNDESTGTSPQGRDTIVSETMEN